MTESGPPANAVPPDEHARTQPRNDAVNALPGGAEVLRAGSNWRGWAVTASVLLVAGLGVYASMLRSHLGDAMIALQEATATVAQLSSELEVTRQDADLLVDTLGVLQAGDLLRIDLSGSGPGVGATGRAFLSRSRGVVFRATNLPIPGASRSYQLWVISDSTPVSIGTFDVNPFGMSTVARPLPAGVEIVSAVAVTDEPAGGSPGPTTAPLLNGLLAAN